MLPNDRAGVVELDTISFGQTEATALVVFDANTAGGPATNFTISCFASDSNTDTYTVHVYNRNGRKIGAFPIRPTSGKSGGARLINFSFGPQQIYKVKISTSATSFADETVSMYYGVYGHTLPV